MADPLRRATILRAERVLEEERLKWLKRGSRRLSAEAAFALRWKTKMKQQIYRWWMSRAARKRTRKQGPQEGEVLKGETEGGKLAATSRSVGAKRKTEGSQHLVDPGKRQKTLVQM